MCSFIRIMTRKKKYKKIVVQIVPHKTYSNSLLTLIFIPRITKGSSKGLHCRDDKKYTSIIAYINFYSADTQKGSSKGLQLVG